MKRQLLGLVRRGALRLMPARSVDLSRLDKIPDSLSWPLKRDGFDPPARLAEVRAVDPVHKLGSLLGIDIWLVTGEEAGRQALTEQDVFSTDIRPYVGKRGAADGDIGGLGFTDPPDHTRLRRLITPEFTMRRLQRIQPSLDRIIAGQLDEIESRARVHDVVDLVPSFAFPIPFLMICELLGLPDKDRETFRELGHARFDVTTGGVGALGAISESREFLKEATARQRREPGPGLIGQIIREQGDEISDYDLAGLADGVFTGGMETSAGMLAMGTSVLLGHSTAWKRMGAEPDFVAPAVEELLRYLSVVQVAFPRFAKQDVVVGGQHVHAGDVVLVSLPGADRDPVFGDAPDSFDPDRPVRSHLAFGHGIHRCVGAELARMELRAAYPAIAQRFPEMHLTDDDHEFMPSSLVYGVRQVLVRPHG
ncbi:cytochrome P450 [Nocardioides alcanivorans]|uniref:cytochrome P450 n=1 Tax=Nocardioides alcanivorans TaxID=2897352 RepID=UPI001F4143A9|nr:cytochrome P450 [Nocardioides alcanivorans]